MASILIKLSDGSEVALEKLTAEQLPLVVLGKNKDGEPNFPLKECILSETPTHRTMRRLFKWGTMPKLVSYDLMVPKTLEGLRKEMTDEEIYKHAVGNYLIAQDKANNGIETKTGLTGATKDLAKKIDKASPEVQAQIKALLAAGFLK